MARDCCSKCKDPIEVLQKTGHRLLQNGYCNKCMSEYEQARRRNPERRNHRLAKRRAHRKEIQGKLSDQKSLRGQAIKREVLSHYGGSCVCCGESAIEFLCIDHVNGDGAAHRRNGGKTGADLYFWLKRNGYPEGFRTLCMNCNCALAYFGYCPHGNVSPVPRTVGRKRKPTSTDANSDLE